MKRSWALDRGHLTAALDQLGLDANPKDYAMVPLALPPKRSPLWLLIFPEGTIASDEEREKSSRYAEREDIVSRDPFHLTSGRLRRHVTSAFDRFTILSPGSAASHSRLEAA